TADRVASGRRHASRSRPAGAGAAPSLARRRRRRTRATQQAPLRGHDTLARSIGSMNEMEPNLSRRHRSLYVGTLVVHSYRRDIPSMKTPEPIVLSWSGGKDSAL